MSTPQTSNRNIETLQAKDLNWRRIMSFVRQHANVTEARIREIQSTLINLIKFTGFWSISRKNLQSIGLALAQQKEEGLTILSPICNIIVLDEHMRFIQKIQHLLDIKQVMFLIPKKIMKSTSGIYTTVSMSEIMPGMSYQEERIIQTLHEQEKRFIERMQLERRMLHRSLGTPESLRLRRTVRTMAEYTNLGLYAQQTGALILNHTTGNIRCYHRVGAGVLHNPVTLA